jgi:parallel beta-helix repeat protein
MRWGHQTPRGTTPISSALVEAMEPRLLYSADLSPVELSSLPNQPTAVLIQTATNEVRDFQTIELVVIDSKVEDVGLLLADIKTQQDAGRQISLLQIASDEDGILRVSQTLADLNSQGFQVSAVHLLSHGDDGQFELGNQVINDRALRQSTQSFSSWSLALTTNADILIYGCNFSETERGQTFASNLAAITGADVAGNREQTGALSLGGDWTLDSQTGAIEASAALSATAQASWGHLLALTAQGQPTVVNTTLAGSQSTGSDIVQFQANAESTGGNKIAADSAGNYVIAWIDSGIAKLQFFNADGTPKSGGEITIPNAVIGSSQRQIAVARNSVGETVATWVEDFGNTAIFGCRFTSDGTQSPSFLVTNDFTAAKPTVAISDSGTFIIAWQAFEAFTGNNIKAQIFDAAAQPLNPQIAVNVNSSGNQLRPAVAMRGDVAVVAWHDESVDAIAIRAFKVVGNTIFYGDEIQASGTTAASQRNAPDVSIDASNLIIVAWQAEESATLHTYYSVLQRGLANADPTYLVKAESRVNPNTSQAQSLPKVALADNGQFVVVQQSANQLPDGAGWGIFARSFAANATALGTAETAVNVVASNQNFSLNNQFAPAVAWRNGANKIVTAWTSDQPGNDNILTRQLNPYAEQIFIVNTDNDVVDPFDGLTSLREAILASNATPNANGINDKIQFNIPVAGGSQDLTINIVIPLPAITDSVDIQGETQEDFNGSTITLRDSSSALGTLFLQRDPSGVFDSSGSSIHGLRIRSVFKNALVIHSANNTIEGNSFFDSGLVGVEIFGNSYTNAGNNTIENNDIYDNVKGGISINNSESNTLKNNRIQNNDGAGITVFSVGSTYFSTGNLIEENTIIDNAHGIDISGVGSFKNVVTANRIGVDSLGNITGNLGAGIRIYDGAADNTIGGTSAFAGNVIAGNASFGIEVNNTSTAAPSRNTLLGNSIYFNGNLGISVDAFEAAPVPMVFVAAQSGTQTVIHGGLNGSPNTAYRIELFSSPSVGPGNASSGRTYLGFVNTHSDGGGYAGFYNLVDSLVPTGHSITATATTTDASYTKFGATSQFSKVLSVGLQIGVAEGTSPLINLAAHTRLAPAGALTFSLINSHDSIGLTLSTAGILSFSTPADYEALIADALGENDNILWITVEVSNGIETETLIHIINIQDRNDAPFISTGPSINAQLGATVAFAGANAIRVSDPDSSPSAQGTPLSLTIYAEIVGAVGYSGQLVLNGQGGQVVQATGTVAQLNSYLSNLTFTGDPTETRSIQLRFTLSDGGSGFGASTVLDFSALQEITMAPASNIAPVISGIPTNFTYYENSGDVALFANASLVNADGPDIVGLTIGYSPTLISIEESFTLPNQAALGSVLLAHDTTAGTITFSGQASTAFYQSLLRSITYTNTSNAPLISSRSFAVFADDGVNLGVTVAMNVGVVYSNDAPSISLGSLTNIYLSVGETLNFNAGLSQALIFSDPDSNSTTLNYALTISLGLAPNSGTLSFSPLLVGALQANGLTVIGDPLGSSTVFFQGQKALITQALSLLVYTPANGHSGVETVSFFLSDLGNIGAGAPLTAQTGLSITTAALLNTPPVVAGVANNQIFTENDWYLPIFNGITLTDTQQSNLTQARVTTTGTFIALEDSQPKYIGITGGIQAARVGNVLTFTGNLPIADYMAALGSLKFINTSESPTAGVRTFTVEVFDGALWSAAVSTNVTVVPVDDLTYLALPTARDVGFGQLMNLSGAPGEIYLVDADAGSTEFEMAITVLHGSVFVGSSTGGTEVRIRGTIAQLNIYLQGQVSYQPNLGFSGNDSMTVQIRLINNATGMANGAPVNTQTLALNVLAGIPPQLNDLSSKANFAENAGPVTLNPSLQITSNDTNIITFATAQISSGYEAGTDLLEVTKVANEINIQWDEATGTLTLTGPATLLQYSLALASLTFNNTSDNPSDSPRQVTLSVVDSLGQSSQAMTDIAVEVFNDLPTINSPALIASFEDTAVDFSLANALQIADPDSDQLVLTISASSGSLRWAGAAGPIAGVRIINANQVELTGSALDINRLASSFQFVPSLNFNGISEVQWSIIDNQGASDRKSTAIQIAPVNDSPIWQSGSSLLTTQGAIAVVSANQSRVIDIEDGASRLTYELSELPNHGSLRMNGNALTLASNFTQADIDNGAITYQHDGSNNASDSLTFTARDSAGGKTALKSVAISIATTPIIVITPAGTGSVNGGSISGGSGGTGGSNTGAVQTSTNSPASASDTKSVAGNPASTASESTAALGNLGTVANNSAQKTVPRNASGTASNSSQSDSVQPALGNSSGTASSASRQNEGAISGINSAQQATKGGTAQDINRAEQGLGNGILRTRTAAENNEYVAILRATLNTPSFTEDLQKVRDEATNSLKLDKNVVASTTAVSATLSIGYVIWLVRGGALLSSLLASMPAWKMMDPLPILGSMGGSDDADQDDDSLDAMIEKSKANRIKEKALDLSAA